MQVPRFVHGHGHVCNFHTMLYVYSTLLSSTVRACRTDSCIGILSLVYLSPARERSNKGTSLAAAEATTQSKPKQGPLDDGLCQGVAQVLTVPGPTPSTLAATPTRSSQDSRTLRWPRYAFARPLGPAAIYHVVARWPRYMRQVPRYPLSKIKACDAHSAALYHSLTASDSHPRFRVPLLGIAIPQRLQARILAHHCPLRLDCRPTNLQLQEGIIN